MTMNQSAKHITANTVILLSWMIIMVALVVLLELHIRKLTIHSSTSPFPSQISRNHDSPAPLQASFR